MKKFNYILLLSAIAGTSLTMTACNEDELDIAQKGVVPMEDFYKTDDDALSALTTMYSDSHNNFAFIPELTGWNYSPFFALTNFLGDDIFLSGSGVGDAVPEREYHDFRMNTSNVVLEGGYTAFYRSIHKCNLLINNFEALPSQSEVMNQCIAQARVMRAYDHMMLGIYWGNPPIVEEVLGGDAQPANAESQAAVMQWVADQIDQALPYLEERKSKDDYEGAVKITKGFAYAVKGKALLWKGDYAGAKTALYEVIKSGKYDLVDDMKKILHADGKGSCEAVFEFNVQADGTNVNSIGNRASGNAPYTFNWRYEYFNTITDDNLNKDGWGWLNPTKLYAETLINNDGMDSKRRKAYILTYDEMLYNLKWASDGDSFVPGETAAKKTDPNRGLKTKNIVYGNCGYFDFKTVMHESQGDNYHFDWCGTWAKNFQIMRYAEVLLMYAEACAQAGDDGTGLKALNDIQKRAESKHISTSLTLEEVQNEKFLEMWQEGCRGVDLIRWKKLETLKTQDWEIPVLHDELADGTGTEHKAKVVWESSSPYKELGAGFVEGKNDFLPFPQTVVDLNSGIQQHQGW